MKKLSLLKPIFTIVIACLLCFFNWQKKDFGISFLLDCLFFIVLALVSIYDLTTMKIPDFCHIAIFILGICSFFLNTPPLSSHILGSFIMSVPFFLLTLFFGGFGGGDIKLCAVSGFYLGASLVVLGCILGSLIAAFYATLLLIHKKAKRTDQLCFGPFLSLGFGVATVFGPTILESYFLLLS